jgi:hypothetical protein
MVMVCMYGSVEYADEGDVILLIRCRDERTAQTDHQTYNRDVRYGYTMSLCWSPRYV